jgi:hypothetical protein
MSDERRLRVALDFALAAPTIRRSRRARGLHFVAIDLEWDHGGGPEVRGSGEALLLALAGRKDALKGLTEPGTDALTQRMR